MTEGKKKQYNADERIKRLMHGSEITTHVRHSRLMDKFDKFAAKEGESLDSVHERLTTLVNIMDPDDNAENVPSYDAKAVSQVHASSKVHEQVSHSKRKTIIQTTDDDQVDSNIIFDDPFMENNGSTTEHDSTSHDEYREIQMLACNVQCEAENQKCLNDELKKQKDLLQRELETFKDRVKTFE
ncbi:hypothetical protein Tco_0733252 [Tanacetum coccineum]